eukprot:3258947-Prymnesium_polylepis.1
MEGRQPNLGQSATGAHLSARRWLGRVRDLQHLRPHILHVDPPLNAPAVDMPQMEGAAAGTEQEDALAKWATLVNEMVDPNAETPKVVRGQPRPLFLLSRPHVSKATASWSCGVLE